MGPGHVKMLSTTKYYLNVALDMSRILLCLVMCCWSELVSMTRRWDVRTAASSCGEQSMSPLSRDLLLSSYLPTTYLGSCRRGRGPRKLSGEAVSGYYSLVSLSGAASSVHATPTP